MFVLAAWLAINIALVWVLFSALDFFSSAPQHFIDYRRYALGAILVLSIAATAVALRYVAIRIFVRLTARWRCLKILRGWNQRDAHARIGQILDGREPFALYLRSFAAERQEYNANFIEYPNPTSQPPQAGSGYLHLEIAAHRATDSAIVAALGKRFPVVALANAADPTPPAGLMVLFAANEDWFEVFVALTVRATAIAIFASEKTSGLLREITYIHKHGLADRAIVLRPGDDAKSTIEAALSRL